jgi:hypothetical protein
MVRLGSNEENGVFPPVAIGLHWAGKGYGPKGRNSRAALLRACSVRGERCYNYPLDIDETA